MTTVLDTLDGSMLGDGSLVCSDRSAHYYASYSGTSHLDCLKDVADTFLRSNIPVSIGYPKLQESVSHGKRYIRATLLTKSCETLTQEYKRWYISGVKEVPKDLLLTPRAIAQWYMDDGCVRGTKCKTLYVDFSVYSFSIESVHILEDQLKNFGILTRESINKEVKVGSKMRLFILQECVNRFMELVEPYVYPSFREKLKWRKE